MASSTFVTFRAERPFHRSSATWRSGSSLWWKQTQGELRKLQFLLRPLGTAPHAPMNQSSPHICRPLLHLRSKKSFTPPAEDKEMLGESLPQYDTFLVHVCGYQKHHIRTVTLQQLCGFQQYLVQRFNTRNLVGGTRQLTAVEHGCFKVLGFIRTVALTISEMVLWRISASSVTVWPTSGLQLFISFFSRTLTICLTYMWAMIL